MKQITLSEAFEDIKQMFQITRGFLERKEGSSFFTQNGGQYSFYFDKREFERDFVIERLYNYFQERTLINGQCRVESLTILYTVVDLEAIKKEGGS